MCGRALFLHEPLPALGPFRGLRRFLPGQRLQLVGLLDQTLFEFGYSLSRLFSALCSSRAGLLQSLRDSLPDSVRTPTVVCLAAGTFVELVGFLDLAELLELVGLILQGSRRFGALLSRGC